MDHEWNMSHSWITCRVKNVVFMVICFVPVTYTVMYEKYLNGTSGGKKGDKMSRRAGSQVKAIFEECGLVGREIFQLGFIPVLDKLERNWVDVVQKEGNSSASTIKNKILAIHHYAEWLLDQEILPNDFGESQFRKWEMRKRKWYTMLNHQQKKEHVKKTVKDLQNMSTPQDIQTFLKSKPSSTTRSKLQGSLADEWDTVAVIPMSEILEARDFLMTSIACVNALRPSGIINMTVEQYLKATYYPQSANYIVKVRQ